MPEPENLLNGTRWGRKWCQSLAFEEGSSTTPLNTTATVLLFDAPYSPPVVPVLTTGGPHTHQAVKIFLKGVC